MTTFTTYPHIDTTYPHIDVIAENGVPFRAVFVPKGAALPNHPKAPPADELALVEFYDRRYNFTPDGQFTGGRYYVRDIVGGGTGLVLTGDVPAWQIDNGTMSVVRDWMRLCIKRG